MTGDSFPILSVADLAAAKAFYERLGFEQRYQFPSAGEPVYVTMERAGAALGISAAAEGDDALAYWVYVDDVDAVVDGLRSAGSAVVAEPVDQPWGERVAQVRDPNGMLVHLGQRAAGDPTHAP